MPDWREAIRQRLEELRLAPTREAEVVEEIAQHLEDRYAELRSGGATEEHAIQEALGELDETDLVRELVGVEHEVMQEPLALGSSGDGRMTGGLWHDVRFGARLLTKDKSVSLVIVVTLGLAIAANTIVFGFTDLILLRPLPWANEARLTEVHTIDGRQSNARGVLSVPQFLDVSRQASSFEAVAAMMPRQLSLTGSGEPLAVAALMVTANFFQTVGVDTTAGRTFLAGEDAPGRSNVVVLSHRFWSGRFNRDVTLIGRTIALNGVAHTVVGVLTPSLEMGSLAQVDVWLPLDARGAVNRLSERNLAVFGLLRLDQTLAMANAELDTIARRLQQQYPVTDAGLQFRAISIRDSNVTPDTWVVLALLTTIVALVLLLACANVAAVMLARATTRRREIAVRLALGATRARLVRQLISEGLLLGVLAGAVGIALAYGGLAGVKSLSSELYFQLLDVNANVVAFAVALSVVTPVLFGVVPAVQLSKPDVTEDLREGGRGGGPSARSHRSRSMLVAAQVAFALTVLIVSGLVIRSIVGIQRVPFGIAADVLCMRVRLDPPKYIDDAARVRAVDELLARLASVPGVTAAAATSRIPVHDFEPLRQFSIVGQPSPAPADMPWAVEATMAGRYRETFQLPLLEGRLLADTDRGSSAAVALISREAARRYWPRRSAIGQQIVLMDGTGASAGDPIAIVGVVDDVKTSTLSQPAPPRIYRALAQRTFENVALAVRVKEGGLSIAPLVRDALREHDPDLAVSEIQRLDAMIDQRLVRGYDLLIVMFVGFAAVGLILAMTGVYGVTAFSAGQRQHEIGVRLALGATMADVIRRVVVRTFKPVAIGIAIGALGGWGVATTIRSFLFETGPLDPSTYLTVTALIAIGGFAASVIPARRAASINPTTVLKRE